MPKNKTKEDMNMKNKIWYFALILTALNLNAHQPRMVNASVVKIENPEVSQAFYASKPATYIIQEDKPFELFVQILRPAIGKLDKNISVLIKKDETEIARLDGNSAEWTFFHEPFANDDYYQGPEYSGKAQGAYTISVTASGKYVFVVGKKEAWPAKEIAKTLYLLPQLKMYFEKSPLLAYWNISGAFAAGIIILLGLSTFTLLKIIRRFKK